MVNIQHCCAIKQIFAQIFCLIFVNMTHVTVKERLKEFVKLKQISIRSFCRVVGVSETYVSSMRNSIQPDKLEKIIVHFPELNPGWLMTGEGKMLRSHDDLILPSIERKELIEKGSEVFKDKLLEMFERGEIYSAAAFLQKDKLIAKLFAKLAILEKELQEYTGKSSEITDIYDTDNV